LQKFFLEDGCDFRQIFDDDLEVGKFALEYCIVVTGGSTKLTMS
jgi:hypothetical protein